MIKNDPSPNVSYNCFSEVTKFATLSPQAHLYCLKCIHSPWNYFIAGKALFLAGQILDNFSSTHRYTLIGGALNLINLIYQKATLDATTRLTSGLVHAVTQSLFCDGMLMGVILAVDELDLKVTVVPLKAGLFLVSTLVAVVFASMAYTRQNFPYSEPIESV